jgi:hypothetical protein
MFFQQGDTIFGCGHTNDLSSNIDSEKIFTKDKSQWYSIALPHYNKDSLKEKKGYSNVEKKRLDILRENINEQGYKKGDDDISSVRGLWSDTGFIKNSSGSSAVQFYIKTERNVTDVFSLLLNLHLNKRRELQEIFQNYAQYINEKQFGGDLVKYFVSMGGHCHGPYNVSILIENYLKSNKQVVIDLDEKREYNDVDKYCEIGTKESFYQEINKSNKCCSKICFSGCAYCNVFGAEQGIFKAIKKVYPKINDINKTIAILMAYLLDFGVSQEKKNNERIIGHLVGMNDHPNEVIRVN